MNRLSSIFAICSITFFYANFVLADTYGPFTYTDTGTSITIERFESDFAIVAEVPETIAGKPVTVIGNHAFWLCWNLKHIVLPSGITRIEDGAFYDCSEVVSINIPAGVTSIGDSAFYGLSEITSLALPASLTYIGDHAFEGCGMQDVKIPYGITRIGNATFGGCSSLARITIPASVSHIDDYAFASSFRLERVVFLGNAPTLGVDVFDNVGDDFVVYSGYYSKGFTYPTWFGYDSERNGEAIIQILNGRGFPLKDGLVAQVFGDAKVGKTGKTKIFTIDNAGSRGLTGLKITKSGAAKGDFKVSVLRKTSIRGYGTMEFKVTFNPKAKGTRNGSIHIESNDAYNPSFEIKLTGKALR